MLDTPSKSIDQHRDDLSSALRLAVHFELHEGICNHFSVQVSTNPELYLINPYGTHWSQLTPDRLLLIDGDGVILEGDGEVEQSAFNIHVQGHRANPRHVAILHTHMPYSTALTMIENGRLEMAHQTALRYWGRLAYEDFYGGLAHSSEAGQEVVAKQAEDKSADVIFLAHHGIVVGGPDVATAFDDLYYLERACQQQVLAMSTGKPLKLIPDNICGHTAGQFQENLVHYANVHLEALKAAYLS